MAETFTIRQGLSQALKGRDIAVNSIDFSNDRNLIAAIGIS